MQGNEQVGPVSEEQFQELLSSGVITAQTYVWQDGMPDWKRYGDLETDGSGVAVAEEGRYCAQCGNRFPTEELLRFGESFVCAACKPVFLQRMREGIPVVGAMRYGGFWIRFAAKLIDNIILSIINGIIRFVGFIPFFRSSAMDEEPDPAIFMTVWAISTLAQLLVAGTYTTWFVGKFAATPGKMACNLKVVMSDGGQVSYLRALGRFFAEILSGMTLTIGYVIAAFDDEKRTLHDRICDTRVIYKQ
jgi:uncharacterized RDD family membrane protein YckC